jgi:hypothetical protein
MTDEITVRAVVMANHGQKMLVDDGAKRVWVERSEITIRSYSQEDGLIVFTMAREIAEARGLS